MPRRSSAGISPSTACSAPYKPALENAAFLEVRHIANQYLGHWVETRLFGAKQPPIEATRAERRWFVFYAVASFLYRIFVMLAIGALDVLPF